jgi:hypothetical protein
MTRKTRKLVVQKSKEERTLEMFERLARYRQLDRKTIVECAILLGVSERSVSNYLADERYQQMVEKMRTNWREEGITAMGNMVSTALNTLLDVMQNDKSGHARFEASAKVLELFGVQVLPEQRDTQDDSAELDRIARLLASRPTTVNIYQQPPEPGGYLPKSLQTTVVESDFEPARQLKRLVEPQEPPRDSFQEWVDGLNG